jgi:hypothetical protein
VTSRGSMVDVVEFVTKLSDILPKATLLLCNRVGPFLLFLIFHNVHYITPSFSYGFLTLSNGGKVYLCHPIVPICSLLLPQKMHISLNYVKFYQKRIISVLQKQWKTDFVLIFMITTCQCTWDPIIHLFVSGKPYTMWKL